MQTINALYICFFLVHSQKRHIKLVGTETWTRDKTIWVQGLKYYSLHVISNIFVYCREVHLHVEVVHPVRFRPWLVKFSGEFVCWAYVQVAWCSAVQLHNDLRRQATNDNHDGKGSWNPNIRRRRLDRTYSGNRNIFNIRCQSMRFKYNLNRFPFRFGLHVVFVFITSVEASYIPAGNSHPFFTVSGRIVYINSKFKCYNLDAKSCGVDVRRTVEN